MKRIVAMLLLLVASPATIAQDGPGPSFFQQVHNCVQMSVLFTSLAQMANDSKDSDLPTFISYVHQIMDKNPNPRTKQMILHIGQAAWATRGQSVTGNAMSMYQECFDSLGTKT